MHDYIALAVPFFFVLIGGEVAWARARNVRVYRFVDAITDLSCGITSQVALVFYASVLIGTYTWAFGHRVVALDRAWVVWLVAFVGVDFLYYWWHRASHEVNVLWAAHVVHHSSEDYNLAVALRQAVLTSWTSLPFYLPLAFLGVPPIVFAAVHSFSTLYQFWIHTELVGRVGGAAGWLLNLPHHHRVHHAINAQYLDKNYGATLIVWDRLFGTYAEEVETPVYGLTKPLGSFAPLWAQVHYWIELARMTRDARGLERVRVWFRSPAASGDAVPVARATFVKYDRPLSRRTATVLLAAYAGIVTATFLLLLFKHELSWPARGAAAFAIVLAVVGVGAVVEGRLPAPRIAPGAAWIGRGPGA